MDNVVLVRADNGYAENVPEDQADAALQSGTHAVPLLDRQNNPVTADPNEARRLVSEEGFVQPNSKQLNEYLKRGNVANDPSQQSKAFLEGLGEGALPFGASTAAETALGVDPETIRLRKEIFSGTQSAGQIAGLIGSAAIPLVGTENLAARTSTYALGKLGLGGIQAGTEAFNAARAAGMTVEAAQAAKAAAMADIGGLNRIGSEAIRGAIATGIMQSGDEASKMFYRDPDQTAESIATDVGLLGILGGGAIGAAVGVAPALWKTMNDTKVGQLLSVIKERAGGAASALPSPETRAMAADLEVPLSNAMNAVHAESPAISSTAQELAQGATKSGASMRQELADHAKDLKEATVKALGFTQEEVDPFVGRSQYEAGTEIADTLAKEVKNKIDPISKVFEEVREKYKGLPIEPAEKTDIIDSLAKIGMDNGYHLVDGTPEGKLLDLAAKSVSKAESLEDLRKIRSTLGKQVQNQQLWSLSKPLNTVLRDAEDNLVSQKLAQDAPELIGMHQQARAEYSAARKQMDELGDRLGIRSYEGPEDFTRSLKDISPESLVKKLTPNADAGLLKVLSQDFPEAAQLVKKSYIGKLLDAGTKRVSEQDVIDPKKVFKALEEWSPELKEYALPPDAERKLLGVKSLLERIPTNMNPSGTARTLDALNKHAASGAFSTLSYLLGHGFFKGAILGTLTRYLTREAPDAVKLGLLKFLGSDLPANSSAFKALAQIATGTYGGVEKTAKATQYLFDRSSKVAPQFLESKPEKRRKTITALNELQQKPEKLLEVASDAGYYAPEHAAAMASYASRAVDFLKSQEPAQKTTLLLDKDAAPSKQEVAHYERMVDLIDQPLKVTQLIKSGELVPTDVTAIKTVYPSLYGRLNQLFGEQLLEAKSKGIMIPYQMRLALGAFMGQPLDSTMTQPSIMALQMNHAGPNLSPQQQGAEERKHGSMKNISKLAEGQMTQSQRAEARHLSNA